MFEALRDTLTKLDIFDLREPRRYRFYSLSGFAIYVLAYMLLISYDPIFEKNCLASITDWKGLSSNCAVTPRSVIFQFIFMNLAFAFAAFARKRAWSSDALFNNISIIIICGVGVTVLLYSFGYAGFIQMVSVAYFIAVSAIVMILLIVASLASRWGWKMEYSQLQAAARSPEVYRLAAIYFVSAVSYYLSAFAVEEL